MSDPRRPLRDDLRGLADAFEASAEPAATVAARLDARLNRRPGRSLALTTAAAAAILALIVVLSALPRLGPAGPPVMPVLNGTWRTVAPDSTGRCAAVLLYDTTPEDGRVLVYAWTGVRGCEARRSNLLTAVGRAAAVRLPADGGLAARDAILVELGPTPTGLLGGLALVLDPASAANPSTTVPGYWGVPAGGDLPAIEWHKVDALDVPYEP